MKCKCYCDGSPSREVEDDDDDDFDGKPDDWEATGQDEMNELHDKCQQRRCITQIRDELNNITDIIAICTVSLLAEKTGLEDLNRKSVSHILFYYVYQNLKEIEEELKHV